MTPDPNKVQDELPAYAPDLRTFTDARLSLLPGGQRIIEAYNATGLALTLLPDRGLDIWNARFQGQPLTWLSPGSPHPPDTGQTWTQAFNGGLLVTCGLTHAGPAETDPTTGEQRPMHGRYSTLQADEVILHRDDDGGMAISGTVWEASLFGPQVALRRTLRLPFAEPALTIHDVVTNHGDTPAPLMLLYHVNMGYPLVRAGAEMVTASRVIPRDAEARKGVETWAIYDAPQPDYAEQVFFHHIISEDGRASAGIVNESFGLALDWDTSALPYLTQWTNTRTGRYVCGVEPATCLPEGQSTARAHDRLLVLAPGESWAVDLTMRVLGDQGAVGAFRAEVAARQAAGKPISERVFTPYEERTS
jgi:hypothetical protein